MNIQLKVSTSSEIIENAFRETVDEENFFLIESRLHDFGFRGCTCVEQSVIGGTAHLLNFTGSDTMSAAFYAQFHLNNGKPVASSIPATEHSVMTAWPDERLDIFSYRFLLNYDRSAMKNMIDKFGGGIFATVMDSYDYSRALNEIVPTLVADHQKKGGLWVLRPDSGDPVEAVMMALEAAEKAFGVQVNSKGFKVIKGCAVIQGDGINKDVVVKILQVVSFIPYALFFFCL